VIPRRSPGQATGAERAVHRFEPGGRHDPPKSAGHLGTGGAGLGLALESGSDETGLFLRPLQGAFLIPPVLPVVLIGSMGPGRGCSPGIRGLPGAGANATGAKTHFARAIDVVTGVSANFLVGSAGRVIGEQEDLRSSRVRFATPARAQSTEIGERMASIVLRAEFAAGLDETLRSWRRVRAW
jgi:hypothetical protein